MSTLILKLNATGDVVRTTTLLRRLSGHVTWVTAAGNITLIDGIAPNLRCVSWEDRADAADRRYDFVINLEDDEEVAEFAAAIPRDRLFGAYLADSRSIAYTDDSHAWFDLSLISRYGREEADRLKLQNRQTYQELIFGGLGWRFRGERYLLPSVSQASLSGDVAISPVAGPVWPMKNWAYYDDLKLRLEASGLRVNLLPRRPSLLAHLDDVRGHRCLVSGDSLPMHFALGTGTPCVTLFTCTSPWEIHEYGVQRKIVSPCLQDYFYQRGYDPRATSSIDVDSVYRAVMDALGTSAAAPRQGSGGIAAEGVAAADEKSA